jgi:DedD protein
VNDSEAAPSKAAEAKPKAAEPKPKAVESKPKAAEPKPKAPPPVDSEAAPPKAPAAESKAKPKAKSAAEKSDNGNFVVQLAALSDADKAAQLREQIVAAGVKAYTEVVPTAKGNVTRVRAGPFGSRDAAEKARDRLKELGLAGNVVPK